MRVAAAKAWRYEAADTAAMSGARDLVYDPWQKRAVVYEQDDQAEGGEIASYALVPGPSARVMTPLPTPTHGPGCAGLTGVPPSTIGG